MEIEGIVDEIIEYYETAEDEEDLVECLCSFLEDEVEETTDLIDIYTELQQLDSDIAKEFGEFLENGFLCFDFHDIGEEDAKKILNIPGHINDDCLYWALWSLINTPDNTYDSLASMLKVDDESLQEKIYTIIKENAERDLLAYEYTCEDDPDYHSYYLITFCQVQYAKMLLCNTHGEFDPLRGLELVECRVAPECEIDGDSITLEEYLGCVNKAWDILTERQEYERIFEMLMNLDPNSEAVEEAQPGLLCKLNNEISENGMDYSGEDWFEELCEYIQENSEE